MKHVQVLLAALFALALTTALSRPASAAIPGEQTFNVSSSSVVAGSGSPYTLHTGFYSIPAGDQCDYQGMTGNTFYPPIAEGYTGNDYNYDNWWVAEDPSTHEWLISINTTFVGGVDQFPRTIFVRCVRGGSFTQGDTTLYYNGDVEFTSAGNASGANTCQVANGVGACATPPGPSASPCPTRSVTPRSLPFGDCMGTGAVFQGAEFAGGPQMYQCQVDSIGGDLSEANEYVAVSQLQAVSSFWPYGAFGLEVSNSDYGNTLRGGIVCWAYANAVSTGATPAYLTNYYYDVFAAGGGTVTLPLHDTALCHVIGQWGAMSSGGGSGTAAFVATDGYNQTLYSNGPAIDVVCTDFHQ